MHFRGEAGEPASVSCLFLSTASQRRHWEWKLRLWKALRGRRKTRSMRIGHGRLFILDYAAKMFGNPLTNEMSVSKHEKRKVLFMCGCNSKTSTQLTTNDDDFGFKDEECLALSTCYVLPAKTNHVYYIHEIENLGCSGKTRGSTNPLLTWQTFFSLH